MHTHMFYLLNFSLLWLLNLPVCVGFFHWATFTPKGQGLCIIDQCNWETVQNMAIKSDSVDVENEILIPYWGSL